MQETVKEKESRSSDMSETFIIGLFMALFLVAGLSAIAALEISGEYAFVIGFFSSMCGFCVGDQVLLILNRFHEWLLHIYQRIQKTIIIATAPS